MNSTGYYVDITVIEDQFSQLFGEAFTNYHPIMNGRRMRKKKNVESGGVGRRDVVKT